MQIGLLKQVDIGLLLCLGVLGGGTFVAKDGRVDTTVEPDKLGLVGLCAGQRADPVVADRLVCVKLYSVGLVRISQATGWLRRTMNEYRCPAKTWTAFAVTGWWFTPSTSMNVMSWLSMENVKFGSHEMLTSRIRYLFECQHQFHRVTSSAFAHLLPCSTVMTDSGEAGPPA